MIDLDALEKREVWTDGSGNDDEYVSVKPVVLRALVRLARADVAQRAHAATMNATDKWAMRADALLDEREAALAPFLPEASDG